MNPNSATTHEPAAAPATIARLLFDSAQRFAGHVAIEEHGECLDYADLPEQVLQVTRGLMALGIQPGDRVGLWAPNSREWILAALGIHCAGAVLVPVNTRMKGAEAADVLARSGCRVLFVQQRFLDVDYPALLAPHRPATLEHQVIFACDQAAVAQDLSHERFLLGAATIERLTARRRALSIQPEAICDLLFTSGTTGKPKGVMSAHGQNLRAFAEYVRVLGLVPGDRYLIVNPFFHAFGYKAGWLTCLIAGATILPHAVFDAEAVFQRIARERISVLPGAPTLYLSLLAHPRLAETDLSSLRVAVTGSASIPPSLIERMRSELGFSVVTTAYGLTECGGLATLCDPKAPAEVIASTSGRPLPGTEVSIRDAANRAVAEGETGEICLRGFHVMQGYFQDPDATAEAIDAEGWLHTGDVGRLDPQGNLAITDRLKDMYIVGGFNCYPAEIEAALLAHPAIAQVAVIGIADARMGEVGCACVVLREGQQLDEQALIGWSRERMANYKVPRQVRFFTALPLNPSNKVAKNDLRHAVAQA
ncbi:MULTISPECIES: FadD3 family acyl-CoA ligase [Pseudomonas]|uniref:Fatty acid--CoA ligase family protein n=2 Tax=Pseudomonas TaxID=286 RepID=A0AAW4BT25_PSEPU|nr:MULTISPECIES: FadD3 family acyl-CoA ligase [Pseudomonas]MBF8644387.1 fatty acid--CoA ligase family protein [Pseudomonas pudica]MBF8701330.1 fatty acid--CoA ligase family protein [Pseudomonas putida]MBF8707843.1 fatty acid--CoA ligase family protein [Pseudomonas putida]MBF8735104.1 fatty acid--CoA ligase family protein [Pseudomonas putida]MBF8759246.1 fatty acid--CoA ligase family protein [Pseudomonas pudica]